MKDHWKERWKDVIGFEGLYQVSDMGRVRSLDRVVPHARFGTWRRKGKILRPVACGPYLTVTLYKDGTITKVMVHRIVATAWFGPRPDGLVVCHGPNGQKDNSVFNLRYDTQRSNALDKRRDGTHTGRPVKRSDGIEFINMWVAAEETGSGCYSQNIGQVCRGKVKTAGGYSWKYI